jgi:methylenetetrahydrofolate dehydrogenase (NADP+)/methenyltetrahydrofolate cyclohydrolase
MSPLGKILSGKAAVEDCEEYIHRKIANLKAHQSGSLSLSLATVQLGASEDVRLYSKSLGKVLARYGVRHIEKEFSAERTEQAKLQAELFRLYSDNTVTGVIIFSPIPSSVDAEAIFLNMPLDKDIEGRTFIKRNPFGVFSPTAKAVMALLRHLKKMDPNFSISGKHAVMVGHSDLVGKPTAVHLSDAGATVTVCHKDTLNLPAHIAEADILVVAIGKPRFIEGSWVKKGAIVLDVGENVVNGRLVGDVDFEAVRERASFISPVPGGVGPLTSLMVIDNLLTLYQYKAQNGNH